MAYNLLDTEILFSESYLAVLLCFAHSGYARDIFQQYPTVFKATTRCFRKDLKRAARNDPKLRCILMG